MDARLLDHLSAKGKLELGISIMRRVLVEIAAPEIIEAEPLGLVILQLLPVQKAIARTDRAMEALVTTIRTSAQEQPGSFRMIPHEHMRCQRHPLPPAYEDIMAGQQSVPLCFAQLRAVPQTLD